MEKKEIIDQPESLLQAINRKLRNSLLVKLCFCGIILLVCQIPMLMVSELTGHRERLAVSVECEVASKWGFTQSIKGPLMAIPISKELSEKNKDGSVRNYTARSMLFVVPDSLKVIAYLEPEIRYRGIYEVMLYRSQVLLEGYFAETPSIPTDWTPELDKARLYIGISAMIGLSNIQVEVDCSDNKVRPGIDAPNAPFNSGMTISVALPEKGALPDGGLHFKASFALNGCRNFSAVPLGKTTTMEISSSWNSPSFDGNFLPVKREVGTKGFQASWEINEFNRNIPPSWNGMDRTNDGEFPVAGVSLMKPANIYSQVTRAVTYSILIFLIVLMAFLIAESVTKTWMHPLQYFLAALSLVLFYALTLALSEHLAFVLSYWLAAAAITGLCVFYCALIFREKPAVIGMGLAVLASYAVIFVLLRLEDYALLAGTLVMFVLLAILMGMTGRMNQKGKEEN